MVAVLQHRPDPSAARRRALGLLGGALLLVSLGAVAVPAGTPLRVSRIVESGTQAVAAEVMAEVYAREGLPLRIDAMPSTRASQEIDDGRLDGEVARIASYFDLHPELLRVGPPLMRVDAVLYVRADAPRRPRGAGDLRGLRVGIVRGLLQSRRAVAGVPGVLEVSTGSQLYRMLAAGRLDAIVDTPLNERLHTARLGLDGIVAAATLASEPVYHGLHRRHADLAGRVAARLEAMRDSGELAALVARGEAAYAAGQALE